MTVVFVNKINRNESDSFFYQLIERLNLALIRNTEITFMTN